MNRLRTEYAERLHAVKTDKNALFSAIICALLLVLILYSFYVRVRMYMLGIPLWDIESRLVENIVDRDMIDMLTPPLANRQTAPVLYLVVVKALTLLFGTSEAVLRAFSFASLVVMLAVQGLLLRRVFRVGMVFTFFSVALSSIFLHYMFHSHELKPYMGDAAFVLLVLFGYYAYRNGSLGRGIRSAALLGLLFVACMLFSTPAAFAAGAVFVVEFLSACIRKDRAKAIWIVIGGLVFIAAFVLNYFLWLKPIATDAGMVNYWDGYRLDLMVFRSEALENDTALLKDLFAPVWHTVWLTVPFAAAGFAVSLVKRNIYTAVIGVFFILLLAASAIGKYPISERLWMFLYVILFIYVFVFIDSLRIHIEGGAAAKAVQRGIPLFLAFLLLAANFSFPAYGRGEEWTLVPGNQADPLISYVRDNIRDGETLYSHISANLILEYKNGYHTDRIGDVTADNIIYGTREYDEDVARVAATGGAYVLYYHSYYPLSHDWTLPYVTEQLQERGYMDQVMDVNHTPLYWFTDDIGKVRAAATLEARGLQTGGGRLSAVFHIENTGETILAPDTPYLYDRLYVVLWKAGEDPPAAGSPDIAILGGLESPLRPGESAEIMVEHEGLEPGEYLAGLATYGEYNFCELGLAPIPVTVDS